MPFYDRRQVTYGVHAIRYLPDESNRQEILDWTWGEYSARYGRIEFNLGIVPTYAYPGDYVVSADNGFVRMLADEFEAKYVVRD